MRDPFVFDFDGPPVRRPGRRPAIRPSAAAALRLRRPGALGRARTRCSPTTTRWPPRSRRRTSGSARTWPSSTASGCCCSRCGAGSGHPPAGGVRYLLGDLVSRGDGLQFKATAGGVVDDGPAFYAPQLMTDGGRTLLWGWAWELGRQRRADRGSRLGRRADLPPRALRPGRPTGHPARRRAGRAAAGDGGAGAPGVPLGMPAFEVVARGPVTLRIAGTEAAVAQVEPSGVRPGDDPGGRQSGRDLRRRTIVDDPGVSRP